MPVKFSSRANKQLIGASESLKRIMLKKQSKHNLALAKDYLIEISKDLNEIDEIE
jgi:hypothetical protein